MTLNTFGAIMGFAAQITGDALVVYRKALDGVKDPALKEMLDTLVHEEEKNCALMERARRENVTEMILEPVTGLERCSYSLDLDLGNATADADFLKAALILEERAEKFFREAAVKVPLPEVARIFRKVAKKKEGNCSAFRLLRLA
jgi:rubrerythrin